MVMGQLAAGLLAAGLSSIFAASKDLVSKKLSFQTDGMVSTFASFGYALPFYLLVLGFLAALGMEHFTWPHAFLLLVFLRALTDTFAEALRMYVFIHGDISVVATFFALSPLFVLVFSPLLTEDRLTLTQVLAIGLGAVGSLLVVQSPSQRGWAEQKKAILLATTAAVFFGLNSSFDRLAMQQETAVFAGEKTFLSELFQAAFGGFSMTLLSALFLLPFLFLGKGRWRQLLAAPHRGPFLLRGLLEVTFMMCKLYAMRTQSAPAVIALLRVSVLLSILGGRLFFHEPDFPRRLAAGLIILLGVALVVFEPQMQAFLPEWW
jgi:drug/metabolite transporter (DMT)-like permease